MLANQAKVSCGLNLAKRRLLSVSQILMAIPCNMVIMGMVLTVNESGCHGTVDARCGWLLSLKRTRLANCWHVFFASFVSLVHMDWSTRTSVGYCVCTVNCWLLFYFLCFLMATLVTLPILANFLTCKSLHVFNCWLSDFLFIYFCILFTQTHLNLCWL